MAVLQHALDRLREAGYRITNARLAVLSVLQESDGHLTSAEIINQVDARDPSIGRASVFRTLELLTSLSLVRPTYLESRTPTYVLLTHEGHHSHIICTNCSRVIELDVCQVDDIAQSVGEQHGIHVTGHLLEFYGICERCAEAGAAPHHTRPEGLDPVTT